MPLQRPAQIPWPYLNPNSPLYQGLVFAGLGPHPGGYDFHDCSPYRNHGRLTNMDPATDWVWVPELGRWALDFDGSDDYVTLPASNQLISSGVTAATISIWLKADVINTDNRCFSLAKGVTTTAFAILVGRTASGKIEGFARSAADALVTLTSASTFVIGVWYHVTLTISGTTATLYVNGIVEATATASVSETLGEMHSTTAKVGASTIAESPFNGQLTGPAIWNHVLSAAEIDRLADPSNAMLECGGSPLILPLRRWWPVAVAGGGTNYTETISDSLGVSDSAARAGEFTREQAESLGVSDVATRFAEYVRSQADSEPVIDVSQAAAEFVRSLADDEDLTDAVARVAEFGRTIAETEGTTDALTRAGVFERALSEALGLTDGQLRAWDALRTIADSEGLTDSRLFSFYLLPCGVAAAQIVQSGVAAGQIVSAGMQAGQICNAGVAAGQIV